MPGSPDAAARGVPALRLGLVPPVVQRNPRFAPPTWEAQAGVVELAEIAETADRVGLDFLCFPEHVAIPVDVAPRRGGTYWAPLPTMGYVAARTHRIALATYCAVLPYHHPLELVKQLGTLDVLSGGRIIAGVGVGSLEPEFELLGAPFTGRGAAADDAIDAIRTCFGTRTPTYRGSHHTIEDVVVEPCGLDRELELWVGGRSPASLRRALDHAHGWAPFGLLPDAVAGVIATVGRPLTAADGRPLELVLPPEPPVDPAGDPDGTLDRLGPYLALGATALTFRFHHTSLSHYLEQVAATAELRTRMEDRRPAAA